MPFDAMPFDASPRGFGAPLLLVLPTGRPVPADLAALRGLGCPVLPFPLVEEGAAAPMPRSPFGLARAAAFALTQRDLPARQALRLGARIAAASRAQGCGAILAEAGDATAAAAIIGARLAGVPLSLSVRDDAAPGLAGRLQAADIVLVTGAARAEGLRALVPQAHLRILPAAIEAPAACRAEDGHGRLLCLAPMETGAGVTALLAALEQLAPDQRPMVDVIGGGPFFDTLRAEALERGVSDHARFLGARPAGWLAAEGPRYRGFVAPDGSPEAALRAMALRLPVIAPATPGMREIVPADCGHLVPPGDALALARALRWLAILPEQQRRLMGEAARDRVLAGHTLATRAAAIAQALAPLLAGARLAA